MQTKHSSAHNKNKGRILKNGKKAQSILLVSCEETETWGRESICAQTRGLRQNRRKKILLYSLTPVLSWQVSKGRSLLFYPCWERDATQPMKSCERSEEEPLITTEDFFFVLVQIQDWAQGWKHLLPWAWMPTEHIEHLFSKPSLASPSLLVQQVTEQVGLSDTFL